MQRINLYHFQEEPTNVVFPLFHLIILGGVFAIILMMISGGTFFSHYRAQAKLSDLKSEEQELNKGFAEVKKSIYTEEDRQQFVQRIQQLEKDKMDKERMYQTLESLHHGESKGFSQYFNALSKYSMPGIWLTDFRFANGGHTITFQGTTADTEFVPKFVQRLGRDESFSGKTFDNFKIFKAVPTQEANAQGKDVSKQEPQIKFMIGSDS